MEIKANEKGSRYIEVSEDHLDTIKRYSLFTDLVDSNGFVDETTLEKLRRNVRALLEATGNTDKARANESNQACLDCRVQPSQDEVKHLLSLCSDVIFHRDMKPLGLRNLLLLYISYNDELDLEGLAPSEVTTEERCE